MCHFGNCFPHCCTELARETPAEQKLDTPKQRGSVHAPGEQKQTPHTRHRDCTPLAQSPTAPGIRYTQDTQVCNCRCSPKDAILLLKPYNRVCSTSPQARKGGAPAVCALLGTPMLWPMPVQSRGWAPHNARTPCSSRVRTLPAAPGGRTLRRTHAAPLHSPPLNEARLSVPGAGAVGRPAPGHTQQESSRPLWMRAALGLQGPWQHISRAHTHAHL